MMTRAAPTLVVSQCAFLPAVAFAILRWKGSAQRSGSCTDEPRPEEISKQHALCEYNVYSRLLLARARWEDGLDPRAAQEGPS